MLTGRLGSGTPRMTAQRLQPAARAVAAPSAPSVGRQAVAPVVVALETSLKKRSGDRRPKPSEPDGSAVAADDPTLTYGVPVRRG